MNTRWVKRHISTEQQKDFLILSCLMILAILFRSFILHFHYIVAWDEPHYLQLGASLAKGHLAQGFHPFWSPMYPICIAVFSFVIPGIELTGRIVSMLCGVLVLIPVYGFARRLFGRMSAIVSSALLALNPEIAYLTTSAYTEPTFICFSLFGIFIGWLALQKRSLILSLTAGILFACSYLTRPEGIGYLGVYLGILAVCAVGEIIRKKTFRKTGMVVFALVSFLILTIPYFIYLHKMTGKWTISAKGFIIQQMDAQDYVDSTLSYGVLSEDNTIYPKDAMYHEGNFLKLVKENRQPTRRITLNVLLKKYATNYYRLLKYGIPQAYGVGLFIFFILGLFRTAWSRQSVHIHLYLLAYIAFFYFIVVPMFHINQRYFVPGIVLSYVWIGKGAIIFNDWLKLSINRCIETSSETWRFVRGRFVMIALVSLLFLGFYWLPELGKIISKQPTDTEYWDDAVELKTAGLWLKNNVPKDPGIMTQNKAVDFYAGIEDVRKGISFPRNSFDRTLAYARHKNVEYMIVTQRYERRYPQLSFLFDDDLVPDYLELVFEDDQDNDVNLRIFRLE